MKIEPPESAKEFYKIFKEGFFESYLEQGMDKHALWSEICEMWRWSVQKAEARTEKGWNAFARNWLKKKGVQASKSTQAVVEVTENKSSLQPILMRVSRAYRHFNVEQLELIARHLNGLSSEDQEKVVDQVINDHSGYPPPRVFQDAAIAIRNKAAMLVSPNVLEIKPDRNNKYLKEQCEKYGARNLFELVKIMNAKKNPSAN